MFNDVLKCTRYDLLRLTIKLGQIYFCTDELALYRDNGPNLSERRRFIATVLVSENERLNTITPERGKYYYVIESNGLYLYDNRWIAQTPNVAKYNSYTLESQVLSPVVNTNDSITSAYLGDKIIDNNGLLGNGSVVIRDSSRVIRGTMESNALNQQLEFKSYYDNGFVFIPNAQLPYNHLSQNFGALHLTTNVMQQYSTETPENVEGRAYYYGDWYNYGNLYCLTRQNFTNVMPDYIPNTDEQLKIFIELNKMILVNGENKSLLTYITIEPLDKTNAQISLIQYYDDGRSVVTNDVGDYIYTNIDDLLINSTFTCTRRITTNNTKSTISCDYNLQEYESIITLRFDNGITSCIVPQAWSDLTSTINFNQVLFKKEKLLTQSDVDKRITQMETEIKEMKTLINELKNKI